MLLSIETKVHDPRGAPSPPRPLKQLSKIKRVGSEPLKDKAEVEPRLNSLQEAFPSLCEHTTPGPQVNQGDY